ncbi:MAG: ABC transporter substrate-binding protein [Nitrospirota bacterium]|nr:ABC transporter substrate-binding protein [Nitrospirota bacterium]
MTTILVVFGLFNRPALGQSAESRAEATVMALAEQTWTLLGRQDLSPEQRQDELAELIESRTDVALLSRLVLGRYWRELTDDQKAEYQRLFRVVIVRNLAGKLRSYAEDADGTLDQHFQIQGSQLAGKGDVLVRAKVLPSSGENLDVYWRVRDRDGRSMIIDLIVEDVSLLVSQRSEFAAVIERNKFEGLLAELQARAESTES